MKFETRVTWEAPLARVLAMITSRAYVEQRLTRMDYESCAVLDCQDDGPRFAITTRVLGRPSVKLPALAQKFVKTDQPIEIEQTDSWDRGTASGTLQIVNKSVSVLSVSAVMKLTESGGMTTNTLSWTVECSVPLVGGKLAEMVADDIRAKAAQNELVSRQILADAF